MCEIPDQVGDDGVVCEIPDQVGDDGTVVGDDGTVVGDDGGVYSAWMVCWASHSLTVSSSTWVKIYLPREASGAHSCEKTGP